MEASSLKLAAGPCAGICSLESSVVKAGTSRISSRSHLNAVGTSSAAVDCGEFVVSKPKICLGTAEIAGDGGRRRSRRGSRSRSERASSSSLGSFPSSSCLKFGSSLSPSLTSPSSRRRSRTRAVTEPQLKDIDTQDLEAETPALLRQCSDLDWKKVVRDLRCEAQTGLESIGLRALSLRALENSMGSWMREQIVDGLKQTSSRSVSTESGWSFQSAATDLRMEANLQAAQALAQGVDSSFDWEKDVAELHQRSLLQGGAEPSVWSFEQQRLWQTWTQAKNHDAESSNQLALEALGSTPVTPLNVLKESPESNSPGQVSRNAPEASSNGAARGGKSLFALGATVASGFAAIEGTWLLHASAVGIAMDSPSVTTEPASRAPSWLVPAVLLFPPISYFIFNYYRDKVNPSAKITDWMFGLVAITIVSNIVMMALWGVRLY